MGRKKANSGREISLPPDKIAAIGGVVGVDGTKPFDKSEDPKLPWRIEALSLAIEGLTERQREVITMRFWEGLTQVEIAEYLSIKQQSVCDIEKQAIKKLGKFIVKLAKTC